MKHVKVAEVQIVHKLDESDLQKIENKNRYELNMGILLRFVLHLPAV